MNLYTATFRFYAELNDFLPISNQGKPIPYEFHVSPSVKDAIESLGIPHTEIDLILIDNNPVSFNCQIKDLDRVSVFPHFRQIHPNSYDRLQKTRHEAIKFILDVHLGRLAKNLRLLGFDSIYDNGHSDAEIAEIADEQNRIVLTRDLGLLKHRRVAQGYWIRSVKPSEQITEVIERFNLKQKVAPFHRCLVCNAMIHRIEKSKIIHKLKPKTAKYYQEFYICQKCDKVYWKGPRYDEMRNRVTSILSEPNN